MAFSPGQLEDMRIHREMQKASENAGQDAELCQECGAGVSYREELQAACKTIDRVLFSLQTHARLRRPACGWDFLYSIEDLKDVLTALKECN